MTFTRQVIAMAKLIKEKTTAKVTAKGKKGIVSKKSTKQFVMSAVFITTTMKKTL